jgi:ammonia channel protein AmtB
VMTTLSACTGGATVLSIHVALKNPPDVSPALNGVLAGLGGAVQIDSIKTCVESKRLWCQRLNPKP